MQFDFFNDAPDLPPITLEAHALRDYGPRTGVNARAADTTVAFATDFTTHGERLTKKVAGSTYVDIPFGSDVQSAADRLIRFMKARGAVKLNVAGNGIYTLKLSKVSQALANQWVYEVLKQVHAAVRLVNIRSGGQTGVDEAGLVAGLALGVPVIGLYPAGFRQRLESGVDVDADPAELLARITACAAALNK